MSSTALKNTRLVAALLAAGAIGGAGVSAINVLHSAATAAATFFIIATLLSAEPFHSFNFLTLTGCCFKMFLILYE